MERLPRLAGIGTSDPLKIRHIHSVQWDHVQGRMVIMAGDSEPASGVYRVNAAGTDVEPMLLNSDLPTFVDGARAIGIIPFTDYLCWTGDSSGNPYLMRIPRSEIGAANPQAERVYRLNSAGWFVCRASDDGSRWVFSSSPESYPATAIDPTAHLYAVEDQGATVYEVGALAVPESGSSGGIPAIAPIGMPQIHGDVFFVQAHRVGRPAVWKATLARGVTHLPWPRRKSLAYGEQTVNSGSVTHATAGTVVFAHTRVPTSMTKLHIFETAVSLQAGGAGTGRVGVRVKGGATLHTGANVSERHTTQQKAGGPIATYSVTPADEIEFIVYGTSGASQTATATVKFAFGQ